MTGQDLRKLYDEDLFVWACRNAQLLREGRFGEADVENIAEEIESLGNEQEHRLESQMARLLLHLLKYEYQPSRRSRSWRGSIANARIEIGRALRRNPSLRSHIDSLLPTAYVDARRGAVAETDLPKRAFPAECPYTFQQIMDDEFLPQ